MYAIAGVSGHTGSVVAETLIAEGKPVRVIVRDAAKAGLSETLSPSEAEALVPGPGATQY